MITCIISAILFAWAIIGLAILAERVEQKYMKIETKGRER